MSNSALQVARTGLDAQSERMRIIANNLANVNTTGFQRDRAEFATLAYQTVTAAGARSSGDNQYATGLNLGTGVRMTGTGRDHHPGLAQHDRATRSISRSRARAISRSCARTARTGYTPRRQFPPLLGGQDRHLGRHAAPARDPDPGRRPVGHDRHRRHRLGHRRRQRRGAPRSARSRSARFVNPAGLQALGNNLYGETARQRRGRRPAPAGAEGRGTIRQGALEGSNVNVVEELVDMIETQRAYEVNSKMIQATDEMLRNANQQL